MPVFTPEAPDRASEAIAVLSWLRCATTSLTAAIATARIAITAMARSTACTGDIRMSSKYDENQYPGKKGQGFRLANDRARVGQLGRGEPGEARAQRIEVHAGQDAG